MDKVTQADREAAIAAMNTHQQVQLSFSHLARAFAAHRIAAIEECAKVARFALRNEDIVGSILALKGGNDD